MSLNTPRAQRSRLGRLAATFGAVAVGTALAFGSAAPASAAQNIDPNVKGSITVHKFEEPTRPTGAKNDGTQVDTTGLKPINGVTFTVQQVNVDLTQPSAWQGLEKLTPAEAATQLKGAPKSLKTATDGVAAFTELPVGLYLVTETDTGANNIAFKGAPFLVTIPLALNNDWNYNVHVYPKNTVTGLVKTIDDSAAYVIGDPVKFTLKAQVPSLPAAEALTSFGITDALDERLKYVSATVLVDGVTLLPADYTIAATGQAFSLSFTTTGLAKVRAVQGNNVTVTVNTTVSARIDGGLGNGTIANTAQVFVNNPANSFNSNTVTTSWGALKVLKYAAQNKALSLTGAEFQLYALNDAEARTSGALRDVVDADTTFTTGADGTFTIKGLKAGKYELVETKAPLGYKLDAKPIKVTVAAGDVATTVPLEISNTQVPAFQLPLTGSTGTALFLGSGLVLVAGGLSLAAIRKRRTAQA